MKTMPKFYPDNPDKVNAYQMPDIGKIRAVLNKAEIIWHDEWVRQGSTDLGSCCGGKCIQVWYAAPRKRSAEPLNIANSPPCQGNMSASQSVEPALAFLKDHGIDAQYYDGWMD